MGTRAVLWSSAGDINANMAFINNYIATTDPGASNDITQGYRIGSTWINRSASTVWTCLTDTAGAAVWVQTGTVGGTGVQGAPAAQDTAATLTAAQIKTGIITSNPSGAVNLQLPLATAMDTAFAGSAAGTSFDFSVISVAGSTNLPTITTNTGWTLVGAMTFTAVAGNAGRFRARKTGTGAWTLYRIS